MSTTSFAGPNARAAPPYLILHRGVPVGRVSLTRSELAVGELEPEAGYSAIRDLIRTASRSLWAVGFLASADSLLPPRPPSRDVIARAAELDLELHDVEGELVPTDFVNIVEREDASLAPAVFVRFRLEPSRDAATAPTPHASGSGRRV